VLKVRVSSMNATLTGFEGWMLKPCVGLKSSIHCWFGQRVPKRFTRETSSREPYYWLPVLAGRYPGRVLKQSESGGRYFPVMIHAKYSDSTGNAMTVAVARSMKGSNPRFVQTLMTLLSVSRCLVTPLLRTVPVVREHDQVPRTGRRHRPLSRRSHLHHLIVRIFSTLQTGNTAHARQVSGEPS